MTNPIFSKTNNFSFLKSSILSFLILAAATNSLISTKSHIKNHLLQTTTTIQVDYSNSVCSKTNPASPNGSECFQVIDPNYQCCYANYWGTKSCFPLVKTSVEAKALNAAGVTDLSNSQILASSKVTSGTFETKCSTKNPFSDAVRIKVNTCGNVVDASNFNCAKITDAQVQCCYMETGATSNSVAKPGQNLSGCIGYSIDFKMPSYAMNYLDTLFSFSCGVDDNMKKLMESCAAIKPTNEKDCSVLTKGDLVCAFAAVKKTTYVCIGMKGDIKAIKGLNLIENLKDVEFVQANSVTAVIVKSSTNSESFITVKFSSFPLCLLAFLYILF